MRYLLLLALFTTVSACRAHLPEAPKTDVCIVSIRYNGCRCVNYQGQSPYTLTFEQCAKYRAMSPDAGEAWDLYIANLEKEVQDCRSSR